jgi:porin
VSRKGERIISVSRILALRGAGLAALTLSATIASTAAANGEALTDTDEIGIAADVQDAAPAAPASLPPAPPSSTPASPAGPINARLVVSQFVDVPVSGDAASIARYSGRADAYITVKGSALGLDDSFTLKLRPEFTWGKTSNGAIGLIPANTALFRPEGAGDFDLSASIVKRWKSGTSLEVGKINLLDVSGELPIVASDGHYGFQNLGLALPPTAIVPNTLTGAMLQVPGGQDDLSPVGVRSGLAV